MLEVTELWTTSTDVERADPEEAWGKLWPGSIEAPDEADVAAVDDS